MQSSSEEAFLRNLWLKCGTECFEVVPGKRSDSQRQKVNFCDICHVQNGGIIASSTRQPGPVRSTSPAGQKEMSQLLLKAFREPQACT